MTKKIVLKVGLRCEKDRKHVLRAVAKFEGINELAVDAEKGTLTIIGNTDAVCIVNLLRKCGLMVEIDSIGPPPKPPEKKPDPPKDNKPKPEPKPEPPPPPPCYRPCPPPCPPYPSPCYYECHRNTCSIT